MRMAMSVDPNELLTQLHPDRRLFQTFAEKTDAVFWTADPISLQIVYISPHVEKALGIAPEVWLRPLFWQTHLHPADLERVVAGFKTAVHEEATHQLEYRLQASDDTLLWIRNTVCMMMAEEKPLLCGMMANVTVYKTAVQYSVDLPGYASIFLQIVTLLSENSDIKHRLEKLAEKLGHVFEVTAVNILDWDNSLGIATQLAHFRAAGISTLPEQNSDSLAGVEGNLKWLSTTHPILIHTNDLTLSEWEEAHLQQHDAKTVYICPCESTINLLAILS